MLLFSISGTIPAGLAQKGQRLWGPKCTGREAPRGSLALWQHRPPSLAGHFLPAIVTPPGGALGAPQPAPGGRAPPPAPSFPGNSAAGRPALRRSRPRSGARGKPDTRVFSLGHTAVAGPGFLPVSRRPILATPVGTPSPAAQGTATRDRTPLPSYHTGMLPHPQRRPWVRSGHASQQTCSEQAVADVEVTRLPRTSPVKEPGGHSSDPSPPTEPPGPCEAGTPWRPH